MSPYVSAGAVNVRVRVHKNVAQPSRLFEPGGPLHGFDRSSITMTDIGSKRAQRLREALGAEQDHPGYVLGRLPSGRYVVLDFGANVHTYACEESD